MIMRVKQGLSAHCRRDLHLKLVAATALWLSGCVGTNFDHPNNSNFIPGKTSQQEVSARMGEPYKTGTLIRNGKTFQSASYVYSKVNGDALYDGVTPARVQGFYFLDGIVVGTEFSSSFKADATDFDETKVALLQNGKSTRADVVKMFGPAGGEHLAPLAPGTASHALVYLYSQTKGSAYDLHFYSKSLVVAYNDSGAVTDVQFTTVGTKN